MEEVKSETENSMMLLLPNIEVDEFDPSNKDKEKVFLIAYNLDISNVVSIEPDDYGRTIIYHKIGQSYLFNIPFSRFLTFLSEQSSLSLYFDRDIDKVDKTIRNKLR